MMSDEMKAGLTADVIGSALDAEFGELNWADNHEQAFALGWHVAMNTRAAIEATTEIETCRWCAEPWNKHAKHCPILKLDSAPIEATTVKGDGLVERLLNDEVKQGPEADPLCQEAADTITTLKGEIERLRTALSELVEYADSTASVVCPSHFAKDFQSQMARLVCCLRANNQWIRDNESGWRSLIRIFSRPGL